MMLKDKVAVVYGAGGDIGGAVARAFAREGAKLFLSGRTLLKVEAVAADIIGRGGVAEAAQVDALDEQDHRHTGAHGVRERRWHFAGVRSGRGADPQPLGRARTAGSDA